jgi:hypothetical protein
MAWTALPCRPKNYLCHGKGRRTGKRCSRGCTLSLHRVAVGKVSATPPTIRRMRATVAETSLRLVLVPREAGSSQARPWTPRNHTRRTACRGLQADTAFQRAERNESSFSVTRLFFITLNPPRPRMPAIRRDQGIHPEHGRVHHRDTLGSNYPSNAQRWS